MKQDLNDILVFIRVIDKGSFTGAASILQMPKSSVSRAVSRLESYLQVRLIQRSTRQLRLTEVGQRYYDHCKRIINELSVADSIVEGTKDKPSGTLKITAPPILGQAFFGPIIACYLQNYAEVDVRFDALNRRVNLIEEGYDLSFRAGILPDSSLIAKKMGTAYAALYASPVYLSKWGVPTTPEDLKPHQKLTNAVPKNADKWRLIKENDTQEIQVKSRYETTDALTLAQVAIAGQGIAELPSFVASDPMKAGDLVRVLPDYYIREVPIHAVYPSYRGLSPAVRAFLEISIEHLTKVLE